MTRWTADQVEELLARTHAGDTVYLVGAGGCGMSGLGHLLLDLGYRVIGSDLAENEEVKGLRLRGATIHLGHGASQVQSAHPRIVVYTPAVRLDNPELVVAEQMEVPIVRRALVLSALMRRRCGICVAGMHGKTTTSAMLAFAMERLQRHPSYAIGAVVPQLQRHARFSSPASVVAVPGQPVQVDEGEEFFVAEADESDGTLREFTPGHSIILNIDEEH
ncbi:MAG TPA: Mur ligase domain-containing protein, partial [Roseimicrobium sp.]|nr:Mur ligase domain-containing protein [Roseimicrobium sp.]